MLNSRTKTIIGYVSGSLRPESGQALLLAVVVMAALTISTAGLVTYATSNEQAFARDSQSARALDIGEAGMQSAVSVVVTNDSDNTVTVGTRLPATGTYSQSLDGGTATYYAVKTASNAWTVYSTGTSASGKLTRQLTANVVDTPVPTPNSPVYSYKFFIVGSASACTSTAGNTTITGSIWIGYDFCPNGSSKVVEPGTGHTLASYVGGLYNWSNNASIGTSSAPFKSITVVKGCGSSTPAPACTSANQAFADTYSQTPSTLTKPTVDADAIYASGSWNAPVCSTGSFVFDGNTTRNMSVASASVNLAPNTAYNCKVYKPGSTTKVEGSLAFDPATNKLTINGTVFIDTDQLNVSGNSFSYTGNGTLYIDGTVKSTGANICGPPSTPSGNSCTGTGWDSTQGSMMIVAINAANAATGFGLTGNGELDITAYTNGVYSQSGGDTVTGPVIADSATLTGGAKINVPSSPPTGAPQGTNDKWAIQAGTWRQVK